MSKKNQMGNRKIQEWEWQLARIAKGGGNTGFVDPFMVNQKLYRKFLHLASGDFNLRAVTQEMQVAASEIKRSGGVAYNTRFEDYNTIVKQLATGRVA